MGHPVDQISSPRQYFHQPEYNLDDVDVNVDDDNNAVEGLGRLQGGAVGQKHLCRTRHQLGIQGRKPKPEFELKSFA